MPRNSTGNYVLPVSNPVAPDTLIDVGWANPTMSDIGAAITDSLDRQGRGTMLAPLKIIDGSAVTPSLAFNSDSSTGMFLAAPNTIGFAVGGVTGLTLGATGATIAEGLHVGGDAFLDGDATLTGNMTLGGTLTLAGGITLEGGIAPGSAALPGLSFVGDLDTGIYSPAADTIGLSTGGIGRMQLDINGQFVFAPATLFGAPTLSVGTSPGGFAIDVVGNGAAADPSLIRFVANGGASVRMLLQCDNVAGVIGTVAALPLEVVTGNLIRMTFDVNGNVLLPTAGSYIALARASDGVLAGALSARGGTAYSLYNAGGATAELRVDAGNILLQTSGAHGLLVDAVGNVGIGSAAPATMGGNITVLEVMGGAPARGGGIRLPSSDRSEEMLIYTADGAGYVGTSTAHPLLLQTGNVERMRIDAAGNASIGGALEVSAANQIIGSGVGQIYVRSTDPMAADLGGQIVLGGSYTGSTDTTFAAISGRKAGGIAGEIGGYLSLSTNNRLAGMVERVRIDTDGNVGIGAPPYVATAKLTLFDGTVGTLVGFNFAACSGFGTYTAHPIAFITNGAERMRLDTDGNLAIGGPVQNGAVRLSVYGHTTQQAVAAGGVSHYLYNPAGTLVYSQGWDGPTGDPAEGISFLTRTAIPLRFSTNLFERMRIDAAGLITTLVGANRFAVALDMGGDPAAVPIGGIIAGTGIGAGFATLHAPQTIVLGGPNSILLTGLNGNNGASITAGTYRILGAINSTNGVFIRIG